MYESLEDLTCAAYRLIKNIQSNDCCGLTGPNQGLIDEGNALEDVANAVNNLAGDFDSVNHNGQLIGDYSKITNGLHGVARALDVLAKNTDCIAENGDYKGRNLNDIICGLNDDASAIANLVAAIERVKFPSELLVDLVANATSVDHGLRDLHKAINALIKTIDNVMKACGVTSGQAGVEDGLTNVNGEVDDLADAFD